MIITGNKLKKLRVEGSCVPIMLVDINLHRTGEVTGLKASREDTLRICKDAVDTLAKELPITYRMSAKKRAWSISKSLYSKYLEPECMNSAKIMMVIHQWIYRLANEARIDMGSQEFIDLIEEITGIYEDGEEKGFVTIRNGEEIQRTKDDVIKRMKSAMKHVTKLHHKAMDKDLYLSVRNDDGELEIVN